MNRSRRIVAVSHCILNASAKVPPLSLYPGVLTPVVEPLIRQGAGLLQLPCPESTYLGINRWGMCREQYDHPRFRRHCARLLVPVVDEIEAFVADGCEILSVIGCDGSPNCGVNRIPAGLTGGVIRSVDVDRQLARFRLEKGTGVFMKQFRKMLAEREIEIPFMAVDERDPSVIVKDERR